MEGDGGDAHFTPGAAPPLHHGHEAPREGGVGGGVVVLLEGRRVVVADAASDWCPKPTGVVDCTQPPVN